MINSPNKSERIVEADDPVEVDKDGNAAITIEELVDFDSCFVEINYLPDRNLSSVQIRSYESRDKMTFPAFFAYATVDDQLINTLIGQTLDCRIFIQLEKEGAIWSTRNNETVRIQVNAVTPQLVARLLPATLKATGHGRVAEASGTITAFRTDRSEANENEAANENQ